MAREIRENQAYDEHLFVIANVTVVVVPRRQTNVKPWIFLDQVLVHRPDLTQIPVGRRQQRVENVDTNVLLARVH